MTQDVADMNFEQALRALEDIVHKLDERGNALRTLCQQRLDTAKARIEAIALGPDGSPTGTAPFDAG